MSVEPEALHADRRDVDNDDLRAAVMPFALHAVGIMVAVGATVGALVFFGGLPVPDLRTIELEPWTLPVLVLVWGAFTLSTLRWEWCRVLELLAVALTISKYGPYGAPMLVMSVGLLAAWHTLRVAAPVAIALLVAMIAGYSILHSQPPVVAMAIPTGVAFMGGRFLRGSVAARLVAERRAEDLAQGNAHLERSLAYAEELAAAHERTRIARELHDSLGHALTIAHVQLRVLERNYDGSDDKARAALGHARAATEDGIAELRRCVSVMRDPIERESFSGFIADFIGQLETTPFEVTFDVIGPERKLPPTVEFALFRALQEGLTNAAKHAEASEMTTLLVFEPDGSVMLVVSDDGRGRGQLREGHGLRGLRERFDELGGVVHVRTAPGDGFELTVRLEATR